MGSFSKFCQVAIDEDGTFDGSSHGIAFDEFDLDSEGEWLENDGLRGTRSQYGNLECEGLINVSGRAIAKPTPVNFDVLLPMILGGAESADSFPLAETLPARHFLFKRDANDLKQYAGVKVNRAVLRGTSGQKVSLELDLWGLGVPTTPGSFPSVSYDTAAPYVFHQSAFTFDSTGYSFRSFTLTIDNFLSREFEDSQTADALTSTGRQVMLEVETPFTSTEEDLADGSQTGNSGSLVLTNGGVSLSFTFPDLRAPKMRRPGARGKDEMRLPLKYLARRTAGTAEIAVTNDSAA